MKISPSMLGMKLLKLWKSSNISLWSIIFRNSLSTTDHLFKLAVPNYHWNFPNLPVHGQISLIKFYQNWIIFPLRMDHFLTTIQPKTLVLILQSFQFVLFSVRKSTFYQFSVIIWRRSLLLITWCASLMKISLCHM